MCILIGLPAMIVMTWACVKAYYAPVTKDPTIEEYVKLFLLVFIRYKKGTNRLLWIILHLFSFQLIRTRRRKSQKNLIFNDFIKRIL